jgi:hypothetical protein
MKVKLQISAIVTIAAASLLLPNLQLPRAMASPMAWCLDKHSEQWCIHHGISPYPYSSSQPVAGIHQIYWPGNGFGVGGIGDWRVG